MLFFNVSSQEKVQIVQNLALLLDNGVPIHKAVSTLANSHVSTPAKKMLQRLAKGIEGGSKFHELLKKERDADTVFVALVEAGEESGTLSHHLAVLSEWLEREHTTKSNIRAALLYPKVILSATIIVAGGLATFVLPKLLPIFKGMRIELPVATKILLGITEFIGKYWSIVLLGVFALIVSYILLMRIAVAQRIRDRLYIQIPIIGTLERSYQISLSMRIIATLYESGISLPRTLHLAAHTTTNTLYRDAWNMAAKEVEQGGSLDASLERYPHLFYGDVVTLASVGENSGSFATTCKRVADFYQKRIEQMTKRLPSVIEPMLLVVMAFLIGFVAVAIILPVYEFTQSASL